VSRKKLFSRGFQFLFFFSFSTKTDKKMLLCFLALVVLSYASVNAECKLAFSQWSQIGSAAQQGMLIENPDATKAENAQTRRRFRVLHGLVKECNKMASKQEAKKVIKYRRPYNGRRHELRKRNGEIQWAVRDSKGRFFDIQDRKLAMAMDRRRTHIATADRED
jgi:hypothetical protein